MFWWKTPKRSKFGRWLDQEGIAQVDFAERSKVSRNTIWRICNNRDYIPSPVVMKKVMSTVRRMDKKSKFKIFSIYKRHNRCAFICFLFLKINKDHNLLESKRIPFALT